MLVLIIILLSACKSPSQRSYELTRTVVDTFMVYNHDIIDSAHSRVKLVIYKLDTIPVYNKHGYPIALQTQRLHTFAKHIKVFSDDTLWIDTLYVKLLDYIQ